MRLPTMKSLKDVERFLKTKRLRRPFKKGIILQRSARECFNMRRFRDRVSVDFAGTYEKYVKRDPSSEELCEEKGTAYMKLR